MGAFVAGFLGPPAAAAPRRRATRKRAKAGEPDGADGADDEGTDGIDDEVWRRYESRIGYGGVHPDSIVEAASMRAVSLPPITYTVERSLAYQIKRGLLSRVQLECIAYAGSRHLVHLYGGTRRAGFFIGDGTGVGKGREIAGIILDNLVRGRLTHVWVSASTDLYLDAERDLRDIGCSVVVHHGLKAAQAHRLTAKRNEAAVLCITYHELVAKGQELLEWLDWREGGGGGAAARRFKGCLVFDECHKGKAGTSSQTGAKMIIIQDTLPGARVVYSSATGFTGVGSTEYLTRMGLWGGQGAPFATFKDFDKLFTAKDVGAMEMIALSFKANGSSVARSIGFDGVRFDTETLTLTRDMALVYRKAMLFAEKVRSRVGVAIALCATSPVGRLQTMNRLEADTYQKHYFGMHQSYSMQILASLKVPLVVQIAKAELKRGHCVVVGIKHTDESIFSKGAEKGSGKGSKEPEEATYQDIPSSAAMGLREHLERFFPTKQTWYRLPTDPPYLDYRVERDDLVCELMAICAQTRGLDPGMFVPLVFKYVYKKPIAVPAYNQDGEVIQCLREKAELLAELDTLALPPCALDYLIDELGGPSKVAEMTGRSHRLVRHPKTKLLSYTRRTKDRVGADKINVMEQQDFQRGAKLVAVISQAASTGISLHSSRASANQRKRVHCTLELPWEAQQMVQQLGRSHRSGQNCPPVFKLITTGIGGENRFLSSISKRLEALGAMTRGNRKATLGAESFGDLGYNSEYSNRVLGDMVRHVVYRYLPGGVTLSDILAPCLEQMTLDLGAEGQEGAGQGGWCAVIASLDDVTHQEHLFDLLQEPVAYITGGVMEVATPEDLEEREGRAPVVYERPKGRSGIRSYEGMVLRVPERRGGLRTDKFFNRILGLPLLQQSLCFAFFSILLDNAIRDAKKSGSYDMGIKSMDTGVITRKVPSRVVFESPLHPGRSVTLHRLARDRSATLMEAIREVQYRRMAVSVDSGIKRGDVPLLQGLTGEQFEAIMSEGDAGFYVARIASKTKVLLAIPVSATQYSIIRPLTGVSHGATLCARDLNSMYVKSTDLETVEREWRREYDGETKKQDLCIFSGDVIEHWGKFGGTAQHARVSVIQANVSGEVITGILSRRTDAMIEYFGELTDKEDAEVHTRVVRRSCPTHQDNTPGFLGKAAQQDHMGFCVDQDMMVSTSHVPEIPVGSKLIGIDGDALGNRSGIHKKYFYAPWVGATAAHAFTIYQRSQMDAVDKTEPEKETEVNGELVEALAVHAPRPQAEASEESDSDDDTLPRKRHRGHSDSSGDEGDGSDSAEDEVWEPPAAGDSSGEEEEEEEEEGGEEEGQGDSSEEEN